MPKISTSTGLDIYYEEQGEGEPLLLIMGTGADHRFWAAQVPAYAEKYRTIVYDSRGVGQTTVPSDPTSCSMAVMADDAAALLDALDIESAHISGLSLGATVAQELCLRHPEKVRTAQLHGAWARSDEWFVRMIETLEYPVHQGDLATFIRYALMWITSPTFLATQPETVAGMEQAFLDAPPAPAGVLGHIHADKHHDALDRLGEIRCPVLVATGENDVQVPPRYGREVAASIPGARFHLFEGPNASHLSCLEMAEEFNRFTLEWLEAHAT
ncbi:MAG: alpha/beta fold hydrolase [Planctomycetota bacterium]|jgi:pimeloyl-ACP methyl ester carboxylesterase